MSDVEELIRSRYQQLRDEFPEVSASMLTPAEREPSALRGQRAILDEIRPTIVFDVGAHFGEGALKLRNAGYRGRIVSFEPQREIFELLAARASSDELWTAQHLALAEKPGTQPINVMRLHLASSLLRPSKKMSDVMPAEALTARSEPVQVETLDNVAAKFCKDDDRVFLQIDVHGFEWNVLQGAERTLKRALGVKIEMALVPMYEGEMLMPQISAFLYERGFRLVGLNPVSVDPRGHLLWVHGYFMSAATL